MRSKVLCAILAFSLIMVFGGNSWSDEEGSKSLIVDDGIYRHPVMKPDMATFRKWIKDYENAPRAFIDKRLMKTMPLTGSLDLLSHLDYTPSERNQGTCGNCWVWSGTGILEVAHSVQESIKDRFSIQYLNSCYLTDDYACCGGNLGTDFVTFYNTKGQVIPWSNTNASFQDASKRCSDGSSSVSCGSVSTSPSYGIASISEVVIKTHSNDGVDKATAIANIKNVLDQNKAVWFAFYLANDADWDVLFDFWNNDSESDVFSFDYSKGSTRIDDEFGGHAVLVVGYNDDDPGNSYWIVLNSWGTETGRPNGLFRMNMDMDYDCTFYDPGDAKNYYSLYFETLDVVFTDGGSSTTTTADSSTTTTADSSTTTTAKTTTTTVEESYSSVYLCTETVCEEDFEWTFGGQKHPDSLDCSTRLIFGNVPEGCYASFVSGCGWVWEMDICVDGNSDKHYYLCPGDTDLDCCEEVGCGFSGGEYDGDFICDGCPSFDISGKIENSCFSHVTVKLSGAIEDEVTTNNNGEWEFVDVPGGGPYYITPQPGGCECEPPQITVDKLKQDLSGLSFSCYEPAPPICNICPLVCLFGENSEEAEALRNFRDEVLSKSPVGQEIIRLYYQWSPVIVKVIEEDEEFKEELKEMINGILPLIKTEVE